MKESNDSLLQDLAVITLGITDNDQSSQNSLSSSVTNNINNKFQLQKLKIFECAENRLDNNPTPQKQQKFNNKMEKIKRVKKREKLLFYLWLG